MTQELSLDAIEDVIMRAVKGAPSPWKDNEQAAAYLTCSPGTLKTWRAHGEGPAYHVMNGKLVRYHVDDLDAFVRGEASR